MTQAEQSVQSSHSSGAAIALLGGVGIIVGSVGAWAKVSAGVFERSIGGMDGDGKITVACGIVVALVALIGMTSNSSRGAAFIVLLASVVAGGVAIYDTVNVNDKAREAESLSEFVSASVGWGLYVVIGGAVVAVIGALMLANARPPARTVASAAAPTVALRACPSCAELIQPTARVCRYCGRDVEPMPGHLAAPASGVSAAWHPDPTGRYAHRYWDGSSWTEHVASADGTSSTDPVNQVS
jgi:hypothetical protein